jgi:hypothetical protein
MLYLKLYLPLWVGILDLNIYKESLLYIYKTEILPTKEIYIGQDHYDSNSSKAKKYFGSGIILKRKINKYRIDNCKKNILIDGIDNQRDLDFFEKILIEANREDFGNRVINIAVGGRGGRHNHTEEAKEKIRITSTGRKMPIEARQKISNWHKNKKLSEEHRKNLSLSHMGQKSWNKGMPCREEVKEALRKSNSKKIIIIDNKNNNKFEFNSRKEAKNFLEKELNRKIDRVGLGSIINGKRKKYKYLKDFNFQA